MDRRHRTAQCSMDGTLESPRGNGLSSCDKEGKHFGYVFLLKIEDF